MDIFLFVAAILSMLATAVIVHLVCKHTKLKALLMGIAFQLVKQMEVIFDDDQMQKTLYSAVVHNCSIDSDDYTSYNLYLFNHTKMHCI